MSTSNPEDVRSVFDMMAGSVAEGDAPISDIELKGVAYLGRALGSQVAEQALDLEFAIRLTETVVSMLGGEHGTAEDVEAMNLDPKSVVVGALLALENVAKGYLETKSDTVLKRLGITDPDAS